MTNADGVRVDEKGPSPDLAHIAFEKREVFILFDSNIDSNSLVKAGIQAFTKELQSRGAIVRLPILPNVDGVNGPDDFLARYRDYDLNQLLKDAKIADNDEEFLTMLARLSGIEYDRQREAAAQKLRVRVGTLDEEIAARRVTQKEPDSTVGQDPTPAAEAVNGSVLLDRIVGVFQTFHRRPRTGVNGIGTLDSNDVRH